VIQFKKQKQKKKVVMVRLVQPIRVLMFGWEFPPVKSGGLGTACYGLTKALSALGIRLTFVLPKKLQAHDASFLELRGVRETVNGADTLYINSTLLPYARPQIEQWTESSTTYREGDVRGIYNRDLFYEVERYAALAIETIGNERYDVIHCHDWMTFKAGIAAKNKLGVPLIVHVHSTEFDRTGGNPNQYVYDIERAGMHLADVVITVSQFTKEKIIKHYGVPADKIKVVYNAVDQEVRSFDQADITFGRHDPVVLFLGRITIQKGPDYFLKAAEKVLQIMPDVKFILAGTGDMETALIREAANKGLSKKVLFAGFLRGQDVDRAFQMADVYVMPSVSEPFGITPLEALKNGTPVIISKQSGVSEVLSHCLKVDFWDIDELVNNVVNVLKHKKTLGREMVKHARQEIGKLTWDKVGERVKTIYQEVLG
jgi:glycosyltransferase involved in cell wall biosynthesis